MSLILTYQFPKEKVSKVESVVRQLALKVKNVHLLTQLRHKETCKYEVEI